MTMQSEEPKANHAGSKRTPASAPPIPTNKNQTLLLQPTPCKSEDRMVADAAVGGVATNAMTLATFSKGTFGELSLADCALALQATVGAVSRGDLSTAEATLTAQALALDAIFGELARRASLNLGTHLSATETYLRLALKAQSQSRATFETLAAIKNPPVVIARQANINNGGQQQVNNGSVPSAASSTSHAAKVGTEPSKLLEAPNGERLDFGAAGETGRAHPHMVPVGAINRAKN